eukprot:2729910-Lingulodinium_polyedra.AAC.1
MTRDVRGPGAANLQVGLHLVGGTTAAPKPPSMAVAVQNRCQRSAWLAGAQPRRLAAALATFLAT